MRSKEKSMALLLVALFSFVGTWSVFGIKVRLSEKSGFSAANGLTPLKTQGFCLTEDELFIIPNQAEGRIDISEMSGSRLELIKGIGWEGNDFIEPTYCFYNQKEGQLGVVDFGKKQILVYDRIGRNEFKMTSKIPCLRLATDIQLIGKKGQERLLIAGYRPDEDGNPYDLYAVNVDDEQTTFLLHSYDKYGLKSNEEYNAQYREKPDIKAKGLDSWFDVQGDDVYFAWSASYKIIKLNIKSRALTFFGQKPRNYVEPSSGKLLEALGKRDLQMMTTARQSMSYISKVYTTQDYVLVIFEGPFTQGNGLNITLQFYDLNGKYLSESAIPGQPGDGMHFEKAKSMLYSFSKNPANGHPGYFISKYRISR